MRLTEALEVGFVLLSSVAVYGFVSVAHQSEARRACVPLCAMHPNYAGNDRTAPDFELPDLEGRKVRLSDFAGKTVIMNFWSSSCRPCLEEMQSIADLAEELRARHDIVVITVSTDDAPPAAIKKTLRSVVDSPPTFITLTDRNASVVTERYGTRLYPETWIIDEAGIIRARFDGARDWYSAMVPNLVDALKHPLTCDIEVQGGEAKGRGLRLCEL